MINELVKALLRNKSKATAIMTLFFDQDDGATMFVVDSAGIEVVVSIHDPSAGSCVGSIDPTQRGQVGSFLKKR